MDWFQRFVLYTQHCMAQEFGFPDCNELWGGLFLVVVCTVGLIVLRFIYRSYGSWRAEQRAVEELIESQRVASPEVMRQFQWAADKAMETDLSYEQMVEKIKGETSKRKDAYQ
jgi:hypothetical protein